ncbi:Autophagy- protein 2 A [Phytophthora pseudosyringae]|uniref:Autophagy-related protein 2 n=1 Tax=Phytophthora pseudosyringae TaxID=221518 RepID=A0A8T1VH57_9STRA|nr:Autophagy- protein 2 A [Phytophthora pseudosyringae]
MQFFKQLTDPALKRLYKFVLKRMIGRFLTDELDLDQLDVHLRSGRLELCDLLLNADVLNAELCEAQGLPFKVKKGYLGSVRVAISYASIMSESCLVEIDDIEIILVPLEKDEAQTRPSCSGTAEEAQEAHKVQKKPATPEPVDEISQEGLDFVASWIEQVTSKIKVTLSNICLRLETGEQHNGRDVALLCKLQWAQFTDESASEVQSVYGRSSLDHPVGMYGSQTMGGGTQSMAASTLFGISQKGIKFWGISMDLHLSSEEAGEEDRWTERRCTEYSDMVLHPFLASDPDKQNYIQVKLSHYEALETPAMDADVFFHSIRIVLQPQYFPELGKIVDAFSTDPAKLNAHNVEDRYTSAAMFQSICDDRPAWMTGSDDGEADEEGGALNLSFKEFQRIEQLLLQYRHTQDELQNAQRRRDSTEEDTPPAEGKLSFKTRKLSAAESVESIGLSDLEEEEDGFFECETELAGSIAPGASLESSSMMGQSMYASARYGFDEKETERKHDDRSQLSWSTTAAQNRAARRVQSRVKVHLLECDCILLYDDLPDDDEDDEEEGDEDSPREREDAGSMTDSRFLRAPVRPTKPLPSVDGLERLELSFKDILFSSLAYSQYSLLAFTIGKFMITEKTLPRMSLDAEEDEAAMLSTCVLKFADTSPVSGRRVNLSANLSAQLRIDFDLESEDSTPAAISSLGVRVNVQPVLLEWDMYLLDRGHRLLALLEEDTSAPKRKTTSTAAVGTESKEFAKSLDMTTECVQVTLRFPMVNSDLIRFGPSSKRGLCEDRLLLTLESVKVASYSPRVDDVGDEDAEVGTPLPPQYRKGAALPWLAEFDASFDNAKVSLLTPENGNQRSSRLDKAVLITASSDGRSGDVCTLRLRLQTPSREEMKDAIASKQKLSQDSTQSPDGASVGSSPGDVSGDDNDGGRVGLNGWNLDAFGRTKSYETAAATASLYSVEIGLPHANAVLFKSSLDRLMVLFDALLMINPIDVDSYNQMLAAAALRNRLLPSYMSLNLTLGEGTVRICDYVSLPPPPSAHPGNASAMHEAEEKRIDPPEAEKVLFTYHFAFQTLKVFQVSQWMGQLVSRVHVLAQNTTLLEEDGRTDAVVPILYRTPFGVSKAPIFFMGVDIADQTNEMREMKVELHLSHLSLRYDVRSKWLFQMLDMVLMEYPIPIIPLDSASMSDEESTKLFETIKSGGDYDAVPLATAPKTVFTKLFVNFYDVLVDYAPLTLTSRVILVLGKVSVSSNVVTGAVMQGYKISAGDLELFLTQARAGYEEIDEVLLGNEIFLRGNLKNSKKKALKFSDTYATGSLDAEYPSLLTFLEKFGFLQIVTMDFVDVFLRVLVPPTALEVASASRGQLEEKSSAASASPELSVELNLGTANIYACFDSFNTLIELLSVWTEQLAIEQEPCDTTAYVGLDGVGDPSSVSVVTNLSPAPASGMRSTVTTASESSGMADFSTSSVRSERHSVGNSGGSGRDFVNILEQIDEDAFGGGKKIFPGKTVATDTEARLLRTRMDSIQKEKNRMVHGLEHDDQLSASELRLRYQQEERRKSAKPIRINELVIEDYYSQNPLFDGHGDETAGAFLMEPEPHQDHEQVNTAGEDPWFSSAATNSPSRSMRMGSSPDKAAMPYNEQAARWLAPGGTPSDVGDGTPKSQASGEDFLLFEPVEEKAPAPVSVQPTSTAPSIGQTAIDYNSDNAYDLEDEDEDDDFDANHFPMGAFPAASKNWWGMENRPDEVELSDLQTEETASSFSHRMDLIEDRSVTHQTFSEAGGEGGGDTHGNDVFPNAMSMSIIDIGEDEGKEIELDFALDGDLQSRFNLLLDMESNSGHEVDDDDDDNNDEEQLRPANQQLRGEEQRQTPLVPSSPRAIPSRQASFSSTSSHPGAPSSSFGMPTCSPPDQPTARWFYDDQRSDDGGPPMTGPPSRIYPHHVEIPVGGSATSLSFGEKDCEDAIRSIARENAARKVEATPPIVVQHVLLRNLNICMRFFGGCDWTRDASEAVMLHPPKDIHAEDTGKQPDSATAKKEKLLDALLDNYVPSDGGDLFGNDGNSSLFTSAKSAPATSFMKRDPATRTTRAASSDSTPSRKRSLKKSGRKTEEMLELVVTRIQLRLDMFNEAEAQSLASHTVLALGNVELLDYISTSQIRKIICYWKSETIHPRESGSSMVRLQLITVRPGPNLCEEHRLKARLLPLRINLDQEVVKFLRQFVPAEDPPAPKKRPARRQIGLMPDETDDDVEITMHEGGVEMKPIGKSALAVEANASLNTWFFQSIDIKPCKIKIDYRPNHVDYAALRAGDYLEVINLFVLEGMELVLRRVQMSGLDGWAALGENVLVSWVQDISRHQIHKCVASVSMPPLRPFVNIGAGAADLILLPMEHYGRDRRLVRGIKKGASSFLKSVTIETLNTASKVAQGTQALLEHADDVVSSSSALRRKQLKYRQAGSRIARNSRRMGGGGIRSAQDAGGGIGGRQYLAQQPASAAEGFGQAYDSLARELHMAAKTIVAVPLVEYKKTGSQGYVRSVIRAVPVAVLRPMIGASEAVAKALIGVRNAVDPELKEDIENKFKDFRAI